MLNALGIKSEVAGLLNTSLCLTLRAVQGTFKFDPVEFIPIEAFGNDRRSDWVYHKHWCLLSLNALGIKSKVTGYRLEACLYDETKDKTNEGTLL